MSRREQRVRRLRQLRQHVANLIAWRASVIVFCVIAWGSGFVPASSRAQGLTAPPVYTSRPDVFAPPGLAKDALPVLDWLIYPSALAGIVVDSNPLQLPAGGGKLAEGLRFAPAVRAERETGINDTRLYGNADGRLFPGQSSADLYSAAAGFTEVYRPLPDLIFNAQADFTRQQNVFASLPFNSNLTLLNPAGVGLSPTVNSATYNQYSSAFSVQKNLSDAFVILDISAADLAYDRTANTVAPAPNGVTYTGGGRVGLWVMPDLYGYFEGSLDTRSYTASSLDSSGYRTVAGIGSDQIGLFRGEVYAGYQTERYRSAGIGTVGGPLFGGRIFYFPLPELTVRVGLDELLGTSLLTSTTAGTAETAETAGTAGTAGTATRVTSLLGEASYALAPEWSIDARGGYIHTDYVGSFRRDDALTIGATITYSVWRSFGLTLDFQHMELDSSAALQGFSRDTITLGATYRY